MLKQITNISNLNDLSLLTELFRLGCKEDEKLGIEFEKLPIYDRDYKAVKYSDIARFITEYKNGKWNGIYSGNNIIGLKNETGTITLEPGSQFEISLNPLESISEIKTALDDYNKETADIGARFGIKWLGYGIQPVSTYRNIKIIPKQRYGYMTKYLPTVAQRPLVMMRETSGIQVGIDYKSEEDAMKKLSLALKLSPLVSALFANSPIRNGRLTQYKSFRALSWLQTDNDRCGLISSRLFSKNPDFTFNDYAKVLLDVPMIFIERPDAPNGAVEVSNLTFGQFLREGYEGYTAELKDWELHSSLYFPEVRLKSFLEIRNHDNQRSDLIPTIPALWKGIIYSPEAMDEINNLLSDFSYVDFQYLRRKTPKCGPDMKLKGKYLWDLIKEILYISYENLKLINEEMFLEPILELANDNLTPADVIIKNWQGCWKKDISKLIEYSLLS